MRIWGACLFVAATASGFAASDSPPRPVDIAALVRQLESRDAKERDAATERLAALNVEKPPAELLAALKSSNPEVRDRAAKAVWTIRTRAALQTLPRGEKFARRGEVDLFVASTATWDLKPDDDRLWGPPFTASAHSWASCMRLRVGRRCSTA